MNCLTFSGNDAFTIAVICEKLNYMYEKIKNKNKKGKKRRKGLRSL